MQTLLDLPLDILYLVLENLKLVDLLNFCASCRTIRQLLRPDKFIWLAENPRADTAARARVVVEASYLMRCHALSELFNAHALKFDYYTVLLQHGASFKPIPHERVLRSTFIMFGDSDQLDFLLENGASFDSLPGGVNQLFQYILFLEGPGDRAMALLKYGARLHDVPCGLEEVIDRLAWRTSEPLGSIKFLIDKGGPLRYAPEGLAQRVIDLHREHQLNHWIRYFIRHVPNMMNILLEDTLLRQGFGPDVDMLLGEGVSFHQVTSATAAERGYGLFARALLEEGADLTLTDPYGWTPLFRAAAQGNTEIVKHLIRKGASLNDRERDGGTPLHAATYQDRHDTVEVLLAAGADHTLAEARHGSTPLHSAVALRRLKVTKVLASYADLDRPDGDGVTPLSLAAFLGSLEIVKVLLDAGADPYCRDHNHLTAIHAAAMGGHAEIVVFFINRGFSPATHIGAADCEEGTPLHIAARRGKLNVVKVLLEHGADLTNKREDGLTAVDVAAAHGHRDLVSFMLGLNVDAGTTPAEDGGTSLHFSCQSGHLDVAKLLIEHGADPALEDKNGMTPIFLAAANGRIAVVRFLIEQQNIDPDAASQADRTPVWAAVSGGHADVLKFLVDNHAQVNRGTFDGMTPLYMATLKGHLDVSKILVENKAEVNARVAHGMTALHGASKLYNLDVVKLLVEHHADVNATSDGGLIPLHVTAAVNSVDNMRFLMQHGSEVNTRTRLSSRTALHISASEGCVDAVKLLIEQEADPTVRDRDGCTPLCCASRHGRLDIVKLLVSELASRDLVLSASCPQDDFHRTPLHWAIYRRHPEVAKFLIDSGIDLRVVDGYGRTALDWACMDRATFHDIVGANYQPTAEDTRLRILCQSVESLCLGLLAGGSRRSLAAEFHALGCCLLLLHDSGTAQFSFEQHLATLTGDDDDLIHQAVCEVCYDIRDVSERFICTICPEVILCRFCMEGASYVEHRPNCQDHEFIHIRRPTPAGDGGPESFDKVSTTVQEWLKGLITQYGCESKVLVSRPK